MPLNTKLLLELAVDLTRSMMAADRYERLLAAAHRLLPCDAMALLRLEGDHLVPLAVQGLVPETRALQFRRADHPRLEIICSSDGPVRFPQDSRLPDPFDGLIEGETHALQQVHSCFGCPLRIDGELVGVLTADALAPGAFDSLDVEFVSLLGALAGAALRTSHLIELTESFAERQGSVARHLMRERGVRGGELVGGSPAMQRLRTDMALVSRSDLAALVTGETGTGKELVARGIHDLSPRREAPFIQVNCAALPESVAESELFGHLRGAYTGAERDRPGRFEIAHGGTLFLDEIGELPLSLQPKLLRAIQQGEVQRVGSDQVSRVDVRIIAATNRDLEREIDKGRFRADLYHRLAVFPIKVPALRERREDVAVLAGYFCDINRRQLGTGPIRLTPEARRLLTEFDWPGNVRELENVVARTVLRALPSTGDGEPVLIDGDLVAPALQLRFGERKSAVAAAATVDVDRGLRELVDEYKRTIISETLRREHGNWAAAARRLGLQRSNLHATAKRLGLNE